MARRAKAAETASSVETTTAPVKRRRRRTVIDHVGQTKTLVAALMTARGAGGAGPDDALKVILWVRGVHAEAAELKVLSTRVRLAKAENVVDRRMALDVHQALLNGVLGGELLVDVDDAGDVVFSSATAPVEA